MTRRDFFAALPAATARPEHKNRRVHHDGQRIYHGPMGLPDYVLDSASRARPYRSTHRHPVLRLSRDGITYLFRSAPSPAMVGEIVLTPEGQYRVHVWSCAIEDRPIRAALDRIEQDRAARMPQPEPAWCGQEGPDYRKYFEPPIMPPPYQPDPLRDEIRRVPLEALDE